jgi:hypothetical protein
LTARTQAQRIFDSHIVESFGAASSAAAASRRKSKPRSGPVPKDSDRPQEVFSDGLAVNVSFNAALPVTSSGNGRLYQSAGSFDRHSSANGVESDQNGTVMDNSLTKNAKSSALEVDDASSRQQTTVDSSTTAANGVSRADGSGRRKWKVAAQLVASTAVTSVNKRDRTAAVGNDDSEGRWMTALTRVSKTRLRINALFS